MITVTVKDILKNRTITATWYTAECTGYYTKTSEKGTLLHMFEIEIRGDRNGVSCEFDNVPTQDYMVPDSAAGMGLKFYIGCGAKVDERNPAAFSFDPAKDCVGKRFLVNVGNELYQGRILNKPIDFLPIPKVA